MTEKLRIGFLGSGGIARAHAYALDAQKYYYANVPHIERVVVASPTPAHREAFADRFGFSESSSPEELLERDDLDAVYILGSNVTHTPQLLKAVENPAIKRIYIEKPVAVSQEEVEQLEDVLKQDHGKIIMMGFQFLQKSPIRKALVHWRSGAFGDLVHFRTEYLHSSYLNPEYCESHTARLLPIPQDGAVVDLGSHVLSLLTAFLGNGLRVKEVSVTNAGLVEKGIVTDLCTIALMEEVTTGGIGTMTASRITAGTGDQLKLELHGTKGSLLFDTANPDFYLSSLPGEGWERHDAFSDYLPASKFSSDYVPSGWLRALVHNHYLFLGGQQGISFIPDLAHGIQVEKLVLQIADLLNKI